MAALDKGISQQIPRADERFAETGAGNFKSRSSRESTRPEYRLRVADLRVRFSQDVDTLRILRVRNRREAREV